MFKVNKNLAKCNVARTIRFTENIYGDLLRISESEQVSFNPVSYTHLTLPTNSRV